MNLKKVAIGCSAALLIFFVLAAALGYYFVYRPASAYIASMRQFAEIPEIEKNVANTAPFTAPDNNELTEDMVKRFVQVQEAMEARLGTRSADLKTKYDQLEQAQKREGRQPTLTETLGALKDLSGIIVEAKRAQVDALNGVRFSLDEYRWVRGRVYAAAGVPLTELNLRDFEPEKVAAAARSGSTPAPVQNAAIEGEVPERNRELVKPYAAKMQQWVALGFFGL
jgi:hypothetical protein